jgi:adenosylcobinamide-phosphate synthase
MAGKMEIPLIGNWPLPQAASLLGAALALDLALGDPRYRLHPVRLMGYAVTGLENRLRALGMSGYAGGVLLAALLSSLSLGIYLLGVRSFQSLHPLAAQAWDLFLLYSLLALGDLLRHVRRVGQAVARGDEKQARFHVARLAGRDTGNLDGPACCRAALESLADGAVDGVWAPLFWYALLGMPGLILFKVASTLDSMVGYKTDRYLRFGWFGARWDDFMNWIPARLSWLLMSAAAFLLPGFSGAKAFRIGLRQHGIFPSPNSGWPEATLAGALSLRLLGPIYRNGQLVNGKWLGDPADAEGASPRHLSLGMGFIIAITLVWAVLFWVCFRILH